jgi:hypothetical protein
LDIFKDFEKTVIQCIHCIRAATSISKAKGDHCPVIRFIQSFLGPAIIFYAPVDPVLYLFCFLLQIICSANQFKVANFVLSCFSVKFNCSDTWFNTTGRIQTKAALKNCMHSN